MRAKQQAQGAPMLKGIPKDPWTPHERDYVQMLREQYQQAQRTYLPPPPHRLCAATDRGPP